MRCKNDDKSVYNNKLLVGKNSVQCVNRLNVSPAVPAVDDSVEAEFVHVPGGGTFVPHEVEGTSHVGVTVVTKQIVLGEEEVQK